MTRTAFDESGDDLNPARARLDTARLPRRIPVRAMIALLGGAVVTIVLITTAVVADLQATLVEMGFDPDRGQLLAGLFAAAVAAASARFVAGRPGPAVVVAPLSFAAVFGGTFASETRDALVTGAQGRFDPIGWTLTLVSLAVAALASGWAASVLAGVVRGYLVGAWVSLEEVWRGPGRTGGHLARPLAVVVVLSLLLLSGPVLADALNFGPEVRMHQAGPLPIALFGGAPPASQVDTGPSDSPPPSTSGDASAGSAQSSKPWLAWRPSGKGRTIALTFPAPWTGGTSQTANVSVYLPPGYDVGSRRYPVLYEVPWSIPYWSGAIAFPPIFDDLIDSGVVPPEIAVFVSQTGGPYPDSECADSVDGRERFETFLVETVVPFIDSSYRTIPDAAARSVFGYSQGGFCSPNLLFRHPAAFGAAITFSGYYLAGLASSQTLNAWRPFGHDSAVIAANSPLVEARSLPPQVRSKLFLVVSGSPTESFYGPQIQAFTSELRQDHIEYALLPDPHGHSWSAVGAQFPAALELVAARQTQTGVFG